MHCLYVAYIELISHFSFSENGLLAARQAQLKVGETWLGMNALVKALCKEQRYKTLRNLSQTSNGTAELSWTVSLVKQSIIRLGFFLYKDTMEARLIALKKHMKDWRLEKDFDEVFHHE